MKIEKILTRDDIENLLVTALEGGSNYWYYLPNLTDVPGDEDQPLSMRIVSAIYDHKASIPVHDLEDGNHLGDLNLVNVHKAETLMETHHPEHAVCIVTEDYDAVTADIWFQLVVMQDVVYG